MIEKTIPALLCATFLLAAAPAMAAPKEIPQGQRDETAMKDTEKQVVSQQKENKEANKNVDRLIDNRK